MNASTQKTAEALSHLLADSYTLYLKTHNFHWNVTGPMFTTLHTLFETQYTELALAVDEIAERIRALGVRAPRFLHGVRGAREGEGRRGHPERDRHDQDPGRRPGDRDRLGEGRVRGRRGGG